MTAAAAICYLCGSDQTYDFFELPPLPTQDGIMCGSQEEAYQVTTGSISLRFCRNCGYIGNEGHEPEKVAFDDYDFSNHQSPIYSKYTRELSQRLIERYDLKGKSIVDIGCGEGEFLRTICGLGGNQGVGIDPGFDNSALARQGGLDIRFVREYYGPRHSQLRSDLIASRHLISLPNDPLGFIRLISSNLRLQPEAILYLETPNVRYTFDEHNIWNVVYEHRSWYAQETLAYMLELAGFDVLNSDLCWNGAYLSMEAKLAPQTRIAQLPSPESLADLANTVANVARDVRVLMEQHVKRTETIKASGKKCVAWGSGAAAVTYFNLFDLSREVPYIVDINSKRQGKYLPGSGQQIVAPEFIQAFQPELLIITNATYEREILEQVHSLGVYPEVWTL
ncbi:MAG: 2-polyprenyl-3-methyl-5-hydroxy-6-metoxy-1,4-benzoquinol methylase [Halioglobus sp.]|jgi:2-polyprenyl-3-methyl-5-hydroxy-6-metoxy-1,4-benzoquinol methylase